MLAACEICDGFIFKRNVELFFSQNFTRMYTNLTPVTDFFSGTLEIYEMPLSWLPYSVFTTPMDIFTMRCYQQEKLLPDYHKSSAPCQKLPTELESTEPLLKWSNLRPGKSRRLMRTHFLKRQSVPQIIFFSNLGQPRASRKKYAGRV